MISMNSIFSMGTVQSYSQRLKTKSLWEQRKQTGYYDKLKENDPSRASFQEQADRMNSEKEDSVLQSIAAKLQKGERLTAAELEKLRTASPELYDEAKKIEEERQGYEERLKKCRTKEDVDKLKLEKLSQSAAKVQSVANNPAIPLAKKLQICEAENRKLEAINEATAEFVKSGAYAALPTQAEEAAKNRAENEAQREELTGKTEEPAAQPEQPPQTEQPAPPKGENAPDAEEAGATAKLPAQVEAAPKPQPAESLADSGRLSRENALPAQRLPAEDGAGRVETQAKKAVASYRQAAALQETENKPEWNRRKRTG